MIQACKRFQYTLDDWTKNDDVMSKQHSHSFNILFQSVRLFYIYPVILIDLQGISSGIIYEILRCLGRAKICPARPIGFDSGAFTRNFYILLL